MSSFNIPRFIGPGPVDISEAARAAMVRRLLPPGSPATAALLKRVQCNTGRLFDVPGDRTTIVPGSGTATLEVGLGALMGPGKTVVACVNGYFSQRLADLARQTGAHVVEIVVPWGETVSPDALEKRILEHSGVVDLVAVAHVETSTGALSPLPELGAVAQRAGALFFVDVVSSVGGYDLSMARLPVDVFCGAAQKCLEGPCGIGVLAFSERGMQALASASSSTTWLGALHTMQAQGRFPGHTFRATPPVQLLAAFDVALQEAIDETLLAREQRHRQAHAQLLDLLEQGGWRMSFPGRPCSHTALVVDLPEQFDEQAALTWLSQERGLLPTRGAHAMLGKAWRLGVMGYLAQPDNVREVALALNECRRRFQGN